MVYLSPASASETPPYNMGATGEAQKLNLRSTPRYVQADTSVPLSGVLLDKLRLSAYVSQKCETLPDKLVGLVSHRVVLGRRQGDIQPRQFRGWTKQRRHEGGVYWQGDEQPSMPSGALLVTAEFNPQKLDRDGWAALCASLRALGIDDPGTLYVDRYDAAFDYLSPRHNLLLDDRTKMMDMFGIGPRGPQTERTGYRKGSDLKAQLYDKTAERRGKGCDASMDVVRFELQVSSPPPLPSAPLYLSKPQDTLTLTDLEHVAYPGDRVTVRAMAFNPLRVADHVYGSLAAYARGMGLRAALGYARHVFSWTSKQRDQWLSVMLPEVDYSPREVFDSRWPVAVRDVIREFDRHA